MNKEEQKAIYDEIVKIYDFTECIIDAIELESNKHPEMQVQLFSPIIEKLQDAADVLTESFVNWAESGKVPDRSVVLNVERTVRKVYISVEEMLEKLDATPHAS